MEERDREELFSKRIRAGKRTYFFDVKSTKANDYFITITESKKRFDDNGYDRHKVFLYKEDFNKFLKAITEAVDYVKTELMPDFDFDAFNHDENEYDGEAPYVAPSNSSPAETTPVQVAPVVEVEPEIDPATITEKKPLEARDTHASQGDNLSSEEVDKW